MSLFDINVLGLDSQLAELKALSTRAEGAAGRAVLKLARRVAEEAKREIAARHISERGTPPDSRTGALVESIAAKMADGTTSEVVADAGHARFLEYGTSKMAPRPFLRLAVAAVQPGFSLPQEFAAELAIGELQQAASDIEGSLT